MTRRRKSWLPLPSSCGSTRRFCSSASRSEARADRPRDPAARRFELLQTQARADVVLKELWRRHGISAERLEAVGHGASGRIAADPKATSVVSFVIAQRARR